MADKPNPKRVEPRSGPVISVRELKKLRNEGSQLVLRDPQGRVWVQTRNQLIRLDVLERLLRRLQYLYRDCDDDDVVMIEDSSEQTATSLATVEATTPPPPLNAQFLLDLFLPEDICEAFLGDLQERYQKKLKRLGKARADWWYRKQVLTSLCPLARNAARRVSFGAVQRLFAFALRLMGLPTLAEAVRNAPEQKQEGIRE